MEAIALKAKIRKPGTKGQLGSLRRNGNVPVSLYGPTTTPMTLSVIHRDMEDIAKQGGIYRKVFPLVIEDGDNTITKNVMIKEIQQHSITGHFEHFDLYEIVPDRKVHVFVPVVTIGKAPGVEVGGLLQIVRRRLEVVCLPDRIPEQITIDVSSLQMGNSVHIKDVIPGEGVTFPHDVNFTIVTVVPPKGTTETKTEATEEVETEEKAGDKKADKDKDKDKKAGDKKAGDKAEKSDKKADKK